MVIAEWVEIGRFGRPHGTAGEVTLRRLSDALSFPYSRLFARGTSYPVLSWRRKGALWLLRLQGIDDRKGAQALTGAVATVPRDDLPSLPPESFYLCDLPGMTVEDETGAVVGTVRDVVTLAGMDYLQIENDQLIPLEQPFVVSVDLQTRRIRMRLPEGLPEVRA